MKYYTYHVIELASRLLEAAMRREDSKDLDVEKTVDVCVDMAVRTVDTIETRCAGRDDDPEV